MSLILEILEELWDTTASYKGVTVNMFGIPINKYKSNSIRSTLSRLHKKGFVNNLYGKWSITSSGKKYIENSRLNLKNFNSPFKHKSSRNLIIMFDIPELRKYERSWLRKHLIKFDYKMIQKSVWVGPSPLQKEFILYLKDIKLIQYIKSFKLAKPYIKKDRSI